MPRLISYRPIRIQLCAIQWAWLLPCTLLQGPLEVFPWYWFNTVPIINRDQVYTLLFLGKCSIEIEDNTGCCCHWPLTQMFYIDKPKKGDHRNCVPHKVFTNLQTIQLVYKKSKYLSALWWLLKQPDVNWTTNLTVHFLSNFNFFFWKDFTSSLKNVVPNFLISFALHCGEIVCINNRFWVWFECTLFSHLSSVSTRHVQSSLRFWIECGLRTWLLSENSVSPVLKTDKSMSFFLWDFNSAGDFRIDGRTVGERFTMNVCVEISKSNPPMMWRHFVLSPGCDLCFNDALILTRPFR